MESNTVQAETEQPKASKVRVLVVDDHPIIRQGLNQIINQEQNLEVVGLAENVKQAMELLESAHPDVAVVDISLKDRSGLDLIKESCSRFPNIKILAYSMHDEIFFVERALRAGAKGYVSKSEDSGNVVLALRKILSGEMYLEEKRAAEMVLGLIDGSCPRANYPEDMLSSREFGIFQLIAQGLPTREIAVRLYISPKTVEAHCEHIKAKLGLKTKMELLRRAVAWSQEGKRFPIQDA